MPIKSKKKKVVKKPKKQRGRGVAGALGGIALGVLPFAASMYGMYKYHLIL